MDLKKDMAGFDNIRSETLVRGCDEVANPA